MSPQVSVYREGATGASSSRGRGDTTRPLVWIKCADILRDELKLGWNRVTIVAPRTAFCCRGALFYKN